MARSTANGAIFGAAAFPNRRRATFPDTTGPASGKGSADADGTINPKTAMPSRIWRLTGLIKFLRGRLLQDKAGRLKEKFSRSDGFPAVKCCSVRCPQRTSE